MNPAARLYGIVQRFGQVSGDVAMQDAWKTILGITSGPRSDEDVFAAVQAFLSEVRITETRLQELGAPTELFARCAKVLRGAFAPAQLGTPWKSHQEPSTRESTLLALQWAGWALRMFDENDIDEDSLEALRAALTEQEQVLADATLPASLRDMLERQVASLRTALQLYKIQGVTPLRDAVHKTVGEVVSENMHSSEAMKDASPEAKSVAQRGLLVLTKAAEIADKGSKVAKFVKEMYDWSAIGIAHAQTAFGVSSTTVLSA